ncbi:membrane protein, putative [Geotalea daltonii FRC-32]|uniref:Membrane protein, putative n=1 Tax=Geotalea daltonii (strain DSM 22248 / JCM 15807 / FRC-32) TaxID=316067 RepID=B9M7P4_GEODF|nr:DMT family transporter [Geotalea daltonii]ACM22150.1 membrane protein, putative [Geotalea daltonii FRC-32]
MNEFSVKLDSETRRATPWLILTTFLWGGSFVFNKIGFREIPPVTFLFLRFLLAAVMMALVCLPRLKKINRDIVRRGAMVGIALTAANLSFVIGVSGTSATRAGFLNNLFVLVVPLLCYLIWRDKVDRLTFAGLCLAVSGIIALAAGGGFSRGDIFSTICALFIALHIISVSKVLRSNDDVYLITLFQFITVTILGGLLVLILPQPEFHMGPVSAGALFYCALFPTVICFTVQNTFQRFTTPTRASLIYTLDPVWSMLGGFALLGERLGVWEALGCVLIFSSVVMPLTVKLVAERRALRLYLNQERQTEEAEASGS